MYRSPRLITIYTNRGEYNEAVTKCNLASNTNLKRILDFALSPYFRRQPLIQIQANSLGHKYSRSRSEGSFGRDIHLSCQYVESVYVCTSHLLLCPGNCCSRSFKSTIIFFHLENKGFPTATL
jgi:hypothetical protein